MHASRIGSIAIGLSLALARPAAADERELMLAGEAPDEIWKQFEACKEQAKEDAHALNACRDTFLDAFAFALAREALDKSEASAAQAAKGGSLEQRFEIAHDEAQGKGKKVRVAKQVMGLKGKAPFFVRSRLAIDADGAPDAYHPGYSCEPKKVMKFKTKAHPEWGCVPTHDSYAGQDWLQNAGDPKGFYGIVYRDAGRTQLCVQGKGDPREGFYVSSTALMDKAKRAKNPCDPTAYVDSNTIPFVSLPRELFEKKLIALGDFAYVYDLKSKKGTGAIVGDVGPRGKIGEASIAVAKALGASGVVKHGGGIGADQVVYLLFPRSGDGQPRDAATIEREAARLLEAWGGTAPIEHAYAGK
jgi:hypothetical protein